MWSPDISYGVPVLVRAIEGVPIERLETASTLVRLERIGIRFVHSWCHLTFREVNLDLEARLAATRTPVMCDSTVHHGDESIGIGEQLILSLGQFQMSVRIWLCMCWVSLAPYQLM